jgi:hypothetical protein
MLLGLVAAIVAGTRTAPTSQRSDAALEGRAPGSRFDHDHRVWTAVLSEYVRGGWVDYRGLVANGQPELDAYLRALAEGASAEAGWTRQERLAFWINAYNAFTVRLILDHYPLRSIRSIGLLPLAAFRTRFIPLGTGGRLVSLNTIENDVLRHQLDDPRIHFAIVCASKSCPALRSDAYRPSVVDQQLDEAARAFLNDGAKNRWEPNTRTLYLSSIFKWFRSDFERAAGTLPAFVARYLEPSHAAALSNGTVRIVFLDYDWSLNER